ncbi:MAG TPA: hypothetical protein VF950_11820 [Planctomycetota bacterium]
MILLALLLQVKAWDTSTSSAAPYAADALAAKTGWIALEKAGPLKGDAVLSNGRVTLVARKGADGLEIHGPSGAVRARLSLDKKVSASLADLGKGGAALETSGARFTLKRGETAVEAVAPSGVLRVESPARFLALPDFFADDIVVDARQIPASKAELPSENFLLHLSGNRDAITMCVFENREQDVRISLAGDGDKRQVVASEIEFGKGRKIWVAAFEGPGLWTSIDLARNQRGRIIPLDWTMPYPAVWRTDFTRHDELIDSWEMLLQEKEGGEFTKPVWFGDGPKKLRANRQVVDQAIGGLLYPCWTDAAKKGFVQPFNEKGKMELSFWGPAVVYPINRMADTPLDAFTVTDVVRATLGVGPCEYILDVEGQKSELKGRATCSVRDELKAMYEKGEQASRKADTEQFLKQGLTFVTHIRARIQGYVDFAAKMRAELKKSPTSPALAEIDKLLAEVDARVAAKLDIIKTPKVVAEMMDAFRKDGLGVEGAAGVEKAKAFGDALVVIGGTQDELVGECRYLVKNLRQRVALMAVKDPSIAAFAGKLRVEAQAVLRAPSVHESARH